MKKRPLFFVGLFSFAAVMICSLSPFMGLAIVAAIGIGVLVFSLVRGSVLPLRLAAVMCAAMVLLSVGFVWRGIRATQLQERYDTMITTLTMRVERETAGGEAYIVRVETGAIEKGTRLCFWVGERAISPRSGDLLTAEVELHAAHDLSQDATFSAKANDVLLYAWPTQDGACAWEDGQASVCWSDRLLYTLRDTIHNVLYRHMEYENAAISEGMMLGARDNLSQATRDAFRASGVYHLLAVSGVHVSIITAAVARLLGLFCSSRRLRTVLTVVSVVMFMALCGFTPSVMRAGIMMIMVYASDWFRRRADGLNSLGVAALLLLTVDPFCVYDLGWQLSFAATLGILMLAPLWRREITARAAKAMPKAKRFIRPLSEAIGVSLCASVLTLPLTVWRFSDVSIVFLIGNLLCVPLSSTLLTMLFAAVLTSPLSGVSDVLFLLCEWMVRLLSGFTSLVSSLPFATVTVNDPWIVVAMLAVLAATAIGYRMYRLRGAMRAACVAAAVAVAVVSVHTACVPKASTITWAGGARPLVIVRTEEAVGLIVSANGDDLSEASTVLREQGITKADWVLWLAQPSVQTVNTTALTISVERLLTTVPPTSLVSLPPARETAMIESGDRVQFDGGDLLRSGDWMFLRVGETTCLLGLSEEPPVTDVQRVDCLWLSQEAIAHIEAVAADTVVVFCDHETAASTRGYHPQVQFAVTDGGGSCAMAKNVLY